MFRKHGRTPMRCPMYLKHQTLGYVQVITRDVSASGIYIGRAEQPSPDWLTELQLGDTLEALVDNADQDAERVRLRVARHDTQGFGLTFI